MSTENTEETLNTPEAGKKLTPAQLYDNYLQQINDVIKSVKRSDLDMTMDALLKPLGEYMMLDLGVATDLALKYITATGKTDQGGKMTPIICADHGVAEMQVSAYPQNTTISMMTNYLISRGAAANALANFVGSYIAVADLGVKGDAKDLPELIRFHIADGTRNSAKGPAMDRLAAVTSIILGMKLAEEMTITDEDGEGFNIILPGEMGISNTTASAAITAAMCQLPATEVTGRGTNISDERLKNKIAVVQQILDVNQPDPNDPIDVLAKVGGFELGAIAGLIIGAAANHAFVILDGFNSSAAALIATALCPNAIDYIAASHLAGERGHQHVLNKLGLEPFMKLDVCLGEAIGSSLAADVLDMSLEIFNGILEPKDKQVPLEKLYEIYRPDKKKAILTDKTFNFYTSTMPELSKEAMEACRSRINSLAKPIYSMGKLEQIAVLYAGIVDSKRPGPMQPKGLICFGNEKIEDGLKQTIFWTSEHARAEVFYGAISPGDSIANAFNLGRYMAEKSALLRPIMGLAFVDEDISYVLQAELLKEDGSLKYTATDFLAHVPAQYKPHVAAMLGALLAGAHSSCILVLDNLATQIVAKYAELLCPDIQKFILNVQPDIYQLGRSVDIVSCFVTCLGMRLIDAALRMLNDMKTFAETQVPMANDGPGLGNQK